ncbi:MAG TPA: metalloregulator ArsR/SmtB family transcription factor [Thermoanaerobaculia bacterium]|nr:metalloregulator ArsR/SmtB family transcription factor [Thermoanaerobaculia bacterium]
MVNSSAALDATFGALADPTRRAILATLALSPESSVGELARPFAISLPAISRHLRVLEEAGLVTRAKDGRVHRCRLVAEPMRDAGDWIEKYRDFWEVRLDALQRYLDGPVESEKERRWKPKRRTGSGSHGRSRPRGSGSSGRGRSPN